MGNALESLIITWATQGKASYIYQLEAVIFALTVLVGNRVVIFVEALIEKIHIVIVAAMIAEYHAISEWETSHSDGPFFFRNQYWQKSLLIKIYDT